MLLLSDKTFEDAYLADGRPIFALTQYLIHRPIAAIGQLGYLRLLTSAWVGLIAVLFFRLVQRLGGGRVEHFAFALAVGTLPCLHTYVAQANFWLAPLAGAATIWATVLTYRAVGSQRKSSFYLSTRLGFAFVLFLCTAATYQPMLAWYWTTALLFLLDNRYFTCREYRRRIHAVIALGLLFLCLYYVAFKLYFVLFSIPPKTRTQLTTAPFYKLYWFLRIQLPLALNLWQLWNPLQRVLTLGTAAAVFGVIGAGYVAACRSYWKQSDDLTDPVPVPARRRLILLRTMLVLFVGLLTHVHWLVIDDVPQSYRVIAPLGAAAFLSLYWALRQLSDSIRSRKMRTLTNRVVMGTVAITALVICQYQAEQYWVAPQTTAYRFMLATIRDGLPPHVSRVHVIRQGPADGLVPQYFVESFGRPSSERDWTISAMTKNALRDSGVVNTVQTITNGAGNDPLPGDEAGVFVIDMRKVALYRMAE